jgi:hypothetical protein
MSRAPLNISEIGAWPDRHRIGQPGLWFCPAFLNRAQSPSNLAFRHLSEFQKR